MSSKCACGGYLYVVINQKRGREDVCENSGEAIIDASGNQWTCSLRGKRRRVT